MCSYIQNSLVEDQNIWKFCSFSLIVNVWIFHEFSDAPAKDFCKYLHKVIQLQEFGPQKFFAIWYVHLYIKFCYAVCTD